MDFEEASDLAEVISDELGWSAELEAGGEGEESYILIMARFERYGFVYNAEIEDTSQWFFHKQQMADWLAKKEESFRGH